MNRGRVKRQAYGKKNELVRIRLSRKPGERVTEIGGKKGRNPRWRGEDVAKGMQVAVGSRGEGRGSPLASKGSGSTLHSERKKGHEEKRRMTSGVGEELQLTEIPSRREKGSQRDKSGHQETSTEGSYSGDTRKTVRGLRGQGGKLGERVKNVKPRLAMDRRMLRGEKNE